MKKVLSLLLALVILLSLSACGKKETQNPDSSTTPSQVATDSTQQTTNGTTEGTQAPTKGPTIIPTEDPTTAHDETPTTKPTETPATKPTACSHSYQDATCTAPKTCTKCGATEGSAAGHSWNAATCSAPKTCSKCGTTEGSAVDHKYTDGKCSFCGKEDIVNPLEHFTPANYVSLEERGQSLSVILLIWHGEEYELADTIYVKTGGDPDNFIDYKGERYYASGGGGPSLTYRLTDTYIEFIDPGNEPCAKYALQHDGSLRLIALEEGWSLPSLYYKGTLAELLSKLN